MIDLNVENAIVITAGIIYTSFVSECVKLIVQKIAKLVGFVR